MSRGGRRYGIPHLPIESCHSISAWGQYQHPQMWASDDTFQIEWIIDHAAHVAHLRFIRQGIDRAQVVRLAQTPCNYGKFRVWFECPNCYRRVGKLCLPETMYIGGNYFDGINRPQVWKFLCRHCYSLTYLQRRDRDHYWTLLHRADRIAERWLGDMSQSDWIGRKKGQHRTTFERRATQYEYTVAAADMGIMERMGRLLGVDVDLSRPH